MQWLERSKTCPQCRNKTTEKLMTRIYFNIPSSEGIDDDAVTLQNKLDTANLQLRLKEGHVKETEDKIQEVNNENTKLSENIKHLKSEVAKYKAGVGSLKEQLSYTKEKVKYIDKVEAEIMQLKGKMKSMEDVYRAVTGGVEEANDVIATCESATTLSAISKALKKELQVMEKKRNILFSSQKRTEHELNQCKKELTQVKDENETLKFELKSHKQCEAEIQALKNKIYEIISISSPKNIDPSLRRVITESPAPMLTKLKPKLTLDDASFEDVNSPSVASRIKEIKDSDSPYLRLKANSMSLFIDKRGNSSKFGNSSTSIFKKPVPINDISSPKKSIPEGEYNGFGGHSKEDRFPTPKPMKSGIKRPKTSIVSSNKLRKLARPLSANTKMDDFLDISGID
ncbi:no poles [Carabus blaptoides fortunei]